jgi:hypothetical protein
MIQLKSGVIELFEIVQDNSTEGEEPTYRTKVLAEFEFDQIEYIQEGQVDKSLVKVAIGKLNVRTPEQAGGPFPSIISTQTKKRMESQPYPMLVRYEYGFKENEIRQVQSKHNSKFWSKFALHNHKRTSNSSLPTVTSALKGFKLRGFIKSWQRFKYSSLKMTYRRSLMNPRSRSSCPSTSSMTTIILVGLV